MTTNLGCAPIFSRSNYSPTSLHLLKYTVPHIPSSYSPTWLKKYVSNQNKLSYLFHAYPLISIHCVPLLSELNILPEINPPSVPGSQPLTHPRELSSSYDSFLHHFFSRVHHSASMQVCCKTSHLSKRPFSMSVSVGLHPAFEGPVPAPLFSTTPSKGSL